MNAPALPLTIGFQGDASLGVVLDALMVHGARPMLIRYDSQLVQPGYHVTEVKAGSFVTLDCGGNPDAWQETILQVEDLPASAEKPAHMEVGKFLTILGKVAERVSLQENSRLTFEVAPPRPTHAGLRRGGYPYRGYPGRDRAWPPTRHLQAPSPGGAGSGQE